MPKHSEIRETPFQAAQMYALVADVAAYPEFLPWCAAARIRSRKPQGQSEVMEADLVISFKVFRERFGSRVTLWPDESRIETIYIDGPFKHMHSQWRFEPCEGGCRIHFFVDFEFRSALLQSVIGLVFNDAMQRVVRAFEMRAQTLYDA